MNRAVTAAVLVGLAGAASGARAQNDLRPDTAPLVQRLMKVEVDSGLVRAAPGDESVGRVVFAVDLHAPNSTWMRLAFDEVALAGDPASGNASYLRITSYLDGHGQRLNAESAAQWANTTAFFNGDLLRLELVAFPGTGDSRVTMSKMWASDVGAIPEDICGVDDRVQSFDARNARYMTSGCTAWMWNDLNNQFSMAGHCGASASGVVQFNVPLSNPNGSVNNPPPEDQYSVEATSIQSQSGGVGADWAYFGVNPNSNTGQQPFQRQGGVRYVLNSVAPGSVSSPPQTIRITGYGTSSAVPTLSQVQKTHTGALNVVNPTSLRYLVDTTGGNSGSPVLVDSGGGAQFNQTVVGVHTHAGCASGGNQGTRVDQGNYRTAVLNPRGVCTSGRAAVSGDVYAIGDWANNLGTVNTATGGFGKVAQVGVRWEGLAYDPANAVFFAVGGNRQLYRVTPAGSSTLVGTLSGALVINGLGYDPGAGVLYGIAQSSGQLVRINTTSAAVTNIGAATGGTVGALEWHQALGKLFGLDDAGGATRLIEFNTGSGARIVVGTLGAGATDCNGLAYNHAGGQLYTIQNVANTATLSDGLLRINPANGAAASVGATGGYFGAGFGMAGVYPAPNCPGDWNGDGVVDFNDLLAYLNDFNAGLPIADLNGDGIVDFNDFLEFLNRYNTPCP